MSLYAPIKVASKDGNLNVEIMYSPGIPTCSFGGHWEVIGEHWEVIRGSLHRRGTIRKTIGVLCIIESRAQASMPGRRLDSRFFFGSPVCRPLGRRVL